MNHEFTNPETLETETVDLATDRRVRAFSISNRQIEAILRAQFEDGAIAMLPRPGIPDDAVILSTFYSMDRRSLVLHVWHYSYSADAWKEGDHVPPGDMQTELVPYKLRRPDTPLT